MKLTEFVLAGCPYCRQAREVLDELLESALADTYDYYRVPSFFSGRERLYEASPLWPRSEVKRRLEEMLTALL